MKQTTTQYAPHNSRSVIEISTSALHHNIEQLVRLSNGSSLGIVIKSNAYGHGMLGIASELEKISAVTWLCTAGIEEAVTLRVAGSTKRILSMVYEDLSISEAIHYNIDISIDDVRLLKLYNDEAMRLQKKLRVHLKVDTGLSRLGLMPDEIFDIVQHAKKYPGLDLYGLFTHLADTNNSDSTYNLKQLRIFNDIIEHGQKAGNIFPCTHALSSGGLTLPFVHTAQKHQSSGSFMTISSDLFSKADQSNNHKVYCYSMVRVGTNAYGLYKSDLQRTRLLEHNSGVKLEPILSWKSYVVDIITSAAGHTPYGYGPIDKARRFAVIPVGFKDGYPQMLAERSSVLIKGRLVPVSYVMLDLMLIDITQGPEIVPADSVVLIGNKSGITATELATAAYTINNELLTRLNPDITRILID